MICGAGVRMCCLRLPYGAERPLLSPCLLSYLHYCRRSRHYTTSCSASSCSSNKKERVIVISGPTGAGKSRLALELAKRLNGEIISADSVQVYRGLDVGSAKTSLSERKEVPHHLIDILHPSEDYSVGQFFSDARQATKDVLDGGHVPIIVGGTGLYLRWLIYGKPDVPKASREIASEVYLELADFERHGEWDAAVEYVVKTGDASAQVLAANDWYRLRRKLEIIRSGGSPSSAFLVPYDSFKEQLDSNSMDRFDIDSSVDGLQVDKLQNLDYDFRCFFLSTQRLGLYRSIDFRCEDMLLDSSVDGLQVDKLQNLDYDFRCFLLSIQRLGLYRSIDFRCEDMLLGNNGILCEAGWLLDLGLLPNSNSATRAIGYRQAMEYILLCREQGGQSSAEQFYYFLNSFQKASRNFAKRQITWVRNEQIYQWIDASKPLDTVLDFMYNSYHDETRNLKVPEPLCMKKDVSDRKESAQLKSYRTRNRHFIGRKDCMDVLEWIRRTQRKPSLSA